LGGTEVEKGEQENAKQIMNGNVITCSAHNRFNGVSGSEDEDIERE